MRGPVLLADAGVVQILETHERHSFSFFPIFYKCIAKGRETSEFKDVTRVPESGVNQALIKIYIQTGMIMIILFGSCYKIRIREIHF